jgi:hypothetical protein
MSSPQSRNHAGGYTAGELTVLLLKGAGLGERPAEAAAIHLIALTGIIGSPEFAEGVTVSTGDGIVTASTRWPPLHQPLDDSGEAVLTIAGSLAAGHPVSLETRVPLLTAVAARAVAEAVLAASGNAGSLHVTARDVPPPAYGGTI